jgi:hypothetical protein
MAEEQSRSLSTPMWQRIVGWSAVSISTLVAGFWGFWGSIENFHEGWFSPGLWKNLALMFVQYLSPMIIVDTGSASLRILDGGRPLDLG